MPVKSSTLAPTKIGSTGNIRPGRRSGSGQQWDHLPGAGSFSNAGVRRSDTPNVVPAGAQKSSGGDPNPGSGVKANPKGLQYPFLPSQAKNVP